MSTISRCRVLCLCLLVIAIGASASVADPVHDHAAMVSEGPINAMCPVTTDEEIDPAFTIEYEGQTIGFCCKKCRRKFDEDPQAYLAELPMLQAVSMTMPADNGHDDGHDQADGDDHAPSAGDHSHADSEADEAHDESGQAGSEHGHDDGQEHDHATGHGKSKSGIAKLIAWLGKFHPPATHLPIGMLIGAALAEGLFIITKRELFRSAGIFCVVIAGFGALGAVTLGWFNGGFVLVDDEWVQTVHRWLGTSTALVTLLTVGLLINASKPGGSASAWLRYRVSLFVAAGMVGATGFFGGALVYGINHYAW